MNHLIHKILAIFITLFKFPHINGLQNTLLGQKLCFSSLPSTTYAIQILHIGKLFLIVQYVLTI